MACDKPRYQRKGKAMAQYYPRPWAPINEEDLSDNDSILSTEAIKSRSEPGTDDEQKEDDDENVCEGVPPEGGVEIGQQPNELKPPTEADMEEMNIIASSNTTDEILTRMHGRSVRRSLLIDSVNSIRSDVQQQFDGAVRGLIDDYVELYFKPAVRGLVSCGGPGAIQREILDKIACDLLDNAKRQFNAISVQVRSPPPLPELREPDAMPSVDSLGPSDANQMPSWLPADSVPLPASPSLDGFRTPPGAMQSDPGFYPGPHLQSDPGFYPGPHLQGDPGFHQGPHLQGDVDMNGPPEGADNNDGLASGSGWASWSSWDFEGRRSTGPKYERPTNRVPVRGAYGNRGPQDGEAGEGEYNGGDEPDGVAGNRLREANDVGDQPDGVAANRLRETNWRYSHYGQMIDDFLNSFVSLMYSNRMFWDSEIINTATRFLYNLQSSLVFGPQMYHPADNVAHYGGGHFLGDHSDLIRYRPDLEDCDWLLRNQLINEPADRVLLLVYDEVAYVQPTDSRYRLKATSGWASVQRFCLPPFIIEKIRMFFSTLNIASRGCITFERPAACELAMILRPCLPLVPARYSAVANWAMAAAATEPVRQPSPQMMSTFRTSFEAVATMVRNRQQAERRLAEAAAHAAMNGDLFGVNEVVGVGVVEMGGVVGVGVVDVAVVDVGVVGVGVVAEEHANEEDVDLQDANDVGLGDFDVDDTDFGDFNVNDINFGDFDVDDFELDDDDENDFDTNGVIVDEDDVELDDVDVDAANVADADVNDVGMNDVDVPDVDENDANVADVEIDSDDPASVAMDSDEEEDCDDSSEMTPSYDTSSTISASDTLTPGTPMTEIDNQPPTQLTTSEILLRIPATITVTTRGSPLNNEVATQPAAIPDSMPDGRNAAVHDEFLMPYLITPELTIFRRGRTDTDAASDSIIILGGGN